QVGRHDQGVDLVELRPGAVGFGPVDSGPAGAGHEPGSFQLLDPFLVEGRPDSALSPWREPLDRAVVVDTAVLTVDPSEAQRLFDQVVIVGSLQIARLLAIDDPGTFDPVRIRRQPIPPGGPRGGHENVLAVGRGGWFEVRDAGHTATLCRFRATIRQLAGGLSR